MTPPPVIARHTFTLFGVNSVPKQSRGGVRGCFAGLATPLARIKLATLRNVVAQFIGQPRLMNQATTRIGEGESSLMKMALEEENRSGGVYPRLGAFGRGQAPTLQ